MITEYAQMEADFEHEFEKRTWSVETVKVLKAFVRKQLGMIEKAYGGCRECYGKAYSTEMKTHPDGTQIKMMHFCVCDRGAALKDIWHKS